VRSGALLVQLDTTDAEKAVRDAETNLETAKLEMEKLKQPVDELTLLQSENSLIQLKESKQKAEDNLIKSYGDGFSNVSNAFLNLPSVMSGLYDILFSSDKGLGAENHQWNVDYYSGVAVQQYDEKVLEYRQDVIDKYNKARASYDKNFDDYKQTSRSADQATIEALIDETYNTTKDIAEGAQHAADLAVKRYSQCDHQPRRNP